MDTTPRALMRLAAPMVAGALGLPPILRNDILSKLKDCSNLRVWCREEKHFKKRYPRGSAPMRLNIGSTTECYLR